MTKTLTIQDIKSQTINTKFGEKEKFSIKFEENPELWVDCWRGRWNSDFTVGKQVEVDDSQWQSREYNGKTYWTIKAPESARGGFQDLQEIKKRLDIIESHLGLSGDNNEQRSDNVEHRPDNIEHQGDNVEHQGDNAPQMGSNNPQNLHSTPTVDVDEVNKQLQG